MPSLFILILFLGLFLLLPAVPALESSIAALRAKNSVSDWVACNHHVCLIYDVEVCSHCLLEVSVL